MTKLHFILVMGGAGVGKNYFIDNNLPKTACVVDVDKMKTTMSVSDAISSLRDILETKFKNKEPLVVHPSIGKSAVANINKLKLAKKYGYKTTIIFLEGTPEQGIKNVKSRVSGGGHGSPIEKIISSYKKSQEAFEQTIRDGSEYIDETKQISTLTTMKAESFNKFFNAKKVLVLESDMLDISILNIDKAKSKLPSLLDVPVTITEKTDGTKLTIVRNKESYSDNWKDNWIVSYKGSIIYPEDYEGISPALEKEVKEKSIGTSQYKYIFDVLKKAHKNTKTKDIPENTELFLEFIMRKPTLTREYTSYHNAILLAASPTVYTVSNGRLFTSPKEFNTKQRNDIAKILDIPTPAVLYTGTIDSLTQLKDVDEIIKLLKDQFLSIPSTFGGIMEGVVLEFDNGQFLKIIQDDQHSKELRQSIKQKYAPRDPENYYKQIKLLSKKAITTIAKQDDLSKTLRELSAWVYGPKNDDLFKGLDPLKTLINVKDDIFLTAKTLLIRQLPGNNNALFLGRFSPLTIAHYNIIDDAIKQYDGVVVNLVKSKLDSDNPFPIEMQIDMLKQCFGDSIEITTSSTGNVLTIIPKTKKVITTVLAGTDRIEGYKKQLLKNEEITVVEIPRTNSISGSLVRKSLRENDKKTFEANTPKQLWGMFDKLRNYV